jgi:hypothetical protein
MCIPKTFFLNPYLSAVYCTGIAHEDSPDTEQIPDMIPKVIFKPVILPGKPTIITFDIETTGLSML